MIRNSPNKSIGEIVRATFSVIAFSIPILASLNLAYLAWENWQLRQDLAQEGILTEAIIQKCSSSTKYGCSITYEFSVIEKEQVKKYTGLEGGLDCGGCSSYKTGETAILIRYIPQNPNQSGIEGVSEVPRDICFAIGGLLIFMLMVGGVYGQTIKSKVQAWWSERKR